jgi:hypothetical protein
MIITPKATLTVTVYASYRPILLKNSFSKPDEKITAFTGREPCKEQGAYQVTSMYRSMVTKFDVGKFTMKTSNELPIGQNFESLKISSFSTE